jgi:choline kinase
MTKAVIVAAGRGRRLGDSTADIPKCMVKVAGRPMLHWQLEALRAAGVTDVIVVRGYRGEHIDGAGQPLRFVENPDWPNNNILASLMFAAHELLGGFYFSYSDIVYAPSVARRLADAADRSANGNTAPDAHLIVDRRWRDAYAGRTLHPIPEAELASVVEAASLGQSVNQVGKQAVPPDMAAGEFIGLARFSAAGAKGLVDVWQSALARGGLEAPFGRARALRHAYVTDALNAMIAQGRHLAPVFIDGQWREIDTEQDLANAEKVVPAWA